MKFPEINKFHKEPVPNSEDVSNAKILEEHLKRVDTRVFVRFYLLILGMFLLTVFGFLVVVGIAQALISLIK